LGGCAISKENAMSEILPCPFCGAMPNLGYRGQPSVEAMMICPKCNATGPASQNGMSGSGAVCDQNAFFGHAVNLWNIRFHPPNSGIDGTPQNPK
jgi:hypothetical protein